VADRQYRSARRFSQPPPLFRWCRDRGLFDRPGRALTFGAGFLREAEELADLGWAVDAVETAPSLEKRPALYEAFAKRYRCRVVTDLESARGPPYRIVTATHVLEFVEDPDERLALLRSLAARLTTKGHLLLSLRGWSDVRAARQKRPRGDGVVTGLGTWTRGYSTDEALSLIESAGLATDDSPTGPRSRSPEQVQLVCRRA